MNPTPTTTAVVATPAPAPGGDKQAASNGGALFIALGVGLLLIAWALRKARS